LRMKAIGSVGIVGLGKMGCPIAGHLVAKGFEVVACDPRAEAREAGAARGARIAASARELARACDLAIVVVGFDSEVEEAIFGTEGLLAGAAPGFVVALGSTVSPSYSRQLAARLAERKLPLLDIPLARGEAAAVEGRLLIYGAGEEAAFEACRPAFQAFASDIFHLGPAGAGQVAKMVNNLILWACISANDEGLRLGEALGVDASRLRQALHHGSAQNWAMDTAAERSGMPWAEKDMRIVLEEADLARLSLPLCGTVKEAIKGLKIRMGLGMPKVPGA